MSKKSVTLTEAQWNVIAFALLNVPAPMKDTAPVYQALVAELNALQPEAPAAAA